TGVAINPSIEVNFSETIESSEVQATINVRNAQGAVAGSTVISDAKLTFIPSADLENDNVYEVSIGSAATSAREIKATSFD
ncbi:Ig-like domain-containing protein, partial [Colwelliaceae bacterium BS250]